jgi:hypothetical protein
MSTRPKEGTTLKIEVTEGGLSIEINGEGEDLVMMIMASMDHHEGIKEIFLSATKNHMIHSIIESTEGGNEALKKAFTKFKEYMNDEDDHEEPLEGNNPHFDFSEVKDLLTDQEKRDLL